MKKLLSYYKLIAVILLWGGVYHVAKFLVADNDIYTVSFLRFLFASILLWILYYKKRELNTKLNLRSIVFTFLVGVIGIFLYNICFLKAETLIPANDIAMLYALTPCITVIFSRIFLKQKISVVAYLGVIVALFGALLVISFSQSDCKRLVCFDVIHHLSIGQLFALLSAFCMSGYNILNKKSAQHGLDPLTITTFSTTFGTILLFFSYLKYGENIHLILNNNIKFWLAMFYISIFATVISYKWYSEAIRDIGVDKSAVFLNGVPLSAVLIGVCILGNSINIKVIFAGLVIITGVLITNFCVKKKL